MTQYGWFSQKAKEHGVTSCIFLTVNDEEAGVCLSCLGILFITLIICVIYLYRLMV